MIFSVEWNYNTKKFHAEQLGGLWWREFLRLGFFDEPKRCERIIYVGF